MHPAVFVMIAAEAWMPLDVLSSVTCISHDKIPFPRKKALQVVSAGLRCPT
jgi:hypothetical protein